MSNLPTLLIVGAPKAGTTALHAALSRHPEVFMCRAQGAEVLAV
jgi:Sulfotransferase family